MDRRQVLKILAALPFAGPGLAELLAKIPAPAAAPPAGLTLEKVIAAREKIFASSAFPTRPYYVVIHPDNVEPLIKEILQATGRKPEEYPEFDDPPDGLHVLGMQVVTNSLVPLDQAYTSPRPPPFGRLTYDFPTSA